MTEVQKTFSFNVPASRLWDAIKGFNDLPRWHPAVEKSEMEGKGIGAVRRLRVAGLDQRIVETLIAYNDKERSLSYDMTETPLPIKGYVAVMRVRDEGGSSSLEWKGKFEPAGAPEKEVVGIIAGIYDAGYQGLKNVLAGKPKA